MFPTFFFHSGGADSLHDLEDCDLSDLENAAAENPIHLDIKRAAYREEKKINFKVSPTDFL